MKIKKASIVAFTCLMSFFVSTAYSASLENRFPAPVIVVNPDSKPVPMKENNKYPVQEEVSSQFGEFGPFWENYANATIYEVPDDKRLVIEYYSCKSQTGSFNTSYTCCISTGESDTGESDTVQHCLPTTPYGHSYVPIAVVSGSEEPVQFAPHMSAGQLVKIYAEPGTQVVVSANRQFKDPISSDDLPEDHMIFSISGYLEDIPQ